MCRLPLRLLTGDVSNVGSGFTFGTGFSCTLRVGLVLDGAVLEEPLEDDEDDLTGLFLLDLFCFCAAMQAADGPCRDTPFQGSVD